MFAAAHPSASGPRISWANMDDGEGTGTFAIPPSSDDGRTWPSGIQESRARATESSLGLKRMDPRSTVAPLRSASERSCALAIWDEMKIFSQIVDRYENKNSS
jgi:hypothetical protein